MAEHQSAQERTERPTPKRREDARRKGQVARSVDLSAASVVLIAAGTLYVAGWHLLGGLAAMMRANLQLSRGQVLDDGGLVPAFGSSLAAALGACAPVLVLALLAALCAPLAVGGWNLSAEALAPDFKRLDPLAGFKRMFSTRGLVELAKAFAKFAAVALVAVLFLWQNQAELLALGNAPSAAAIGQALGLTGQALLALGAALLLIAAVDVPWQLWQHTQKLKMTRQEVREELKETEGSPEVKGRLRAAQQEIARRRMMQEVPRADVVVVNPTHYAVALRYDELCMRAPVVVAKGTDAVALRIRAVAEEHAVPIFEAPPLARALHAGCDLGQEIPGTLYVAVAQVLTYVYQLRTARRAGSAPPAPPAIDPGADEPRH